MFRRVLPLAAFLIALALALTARSGNAGGGPTYKIGSKIADFKFKSDQGKYVKLSDYRGKTVVLTMFATW